MAGTCVGGENGGRARKARAQGLRQGTNTGGKTSNGVVKGTNERGVRKEGRRKARNQRGTTTTQKGKVKGNAHHGESNTGVGRLGHKAGPRSWAKAGRHTARACMGKVSSLGRLGLGGTTRHTGINGHTTWQSLQ